MVPSVLAGFAAIVSIASALPQAPPAGQSCQQFGSGSQVDGYTVTCGADRPGGDLSNAQASSFSACFPLCDSLAGCVGFVYNENAGFCYFKSTLNGQVSSAGNDVAVKPASTTPAGKSCQQIGNGVQYDGYTTECGIDHYGGDLTSAQGASFSDCFPICDANTACVGFTYHPGNNGAAGTCYLKSSLTTATASSGDDSAVKGSSSSSTTTTTTASTTPSTTKAVTTTTTSARASSTTASATTQAAGAPGFPIPIIPIPTINPASPGLPIPTISIITVPIPTLPGLPGSPASPTTTTKAITTPALPSPKPIVCTKNVFGFTVIVPCI